MNENQWQYMHEKFGTCLMSMVMNYKHGRISSVELLDLIEVYCEESYKIGTGEVSDFTLKNIEDEE